MNRKELTEKRIDLKTQLEDMLETSKTEKRALTTEETAQFDEIEQEIRNIDATLDRMDRVESMEERVIIEDREETVEERDYREFAGFIRSQVTGIETRDSNLTMGDNGAVIPRTIVAKIIEKVEEISPIYAMSTRYTIGGTVVIPTEDDSEDGITVAYASEFSDLTSHANKFGSIELTGFLYGALTKISKSLLRNSDFDLTTWVIYKMARKIAAFIENEILNGSPSKTTGVAGSFDTVNMKLELAAQNAITTDELIDLQELVPDVYQNACIWVMNKATRTAIRKLKDNDGKYILEKDATARWGYTLFGQPVYTTKSAAKLGTASKNVIFYGDFSGLAVKESEAPELQILTELYAAQHAIGVVAWGEIDAKIEDVQKIAVAVTPA